MATTSGSGSVLAQASARSLVAGDLEAVFLPGQGMLGASFKYRGDELLGRVENLEAAAAKGSTAGIPLLYPWANRLAGPGYRAAGREVVLDRSSPFLHLDEHGLPIHGVPWARLAWEVTEATKDRLGARLDWSGRDLLSVFPFPHQVDLLVTLAPDALTLETTVVAHSTGPVPVSFGFHPYFSVAGQARGSWRLSLPAMKRLVQDAQGIPTGEEVAFAGLDASLGSLRFDDGFALSGERASLSLQGANRRLSVEFLSGYRFAQVFAPPEKDFIALEPMTAPTGALTSGSGLRCVEPNERFRAAFRIRVEELSFDGGQP
jgi:aldose 1-epimerase